MNPRDTLDPMRLLEDVLDAMRLLDSLPASDQRTVRVRAMREAVRHVLRGLMGVDNGATIL